MKMRRGIVAIAASAIMLMGTLPQTTLTVCAEEAQQATTTMYATANVNVRASDSASSKKLGTLTKGQAITSSGKTEKGWYIVDFNGQTGYVSGKYLTDTNSTTPVPETTTTQANNAAPTSAVPDGTTKTFSDGTVFVVRGQTPNGLPIWYMQSDKGTWDDYIIEAYDKTGITNDMSDYDKAVAINNYICKVVDYAEVGADDRALYSACLTYGQATCVGYTHAFTMLCTIAGVGADKVGGTAGGNAHVWNYVLIGDTKYWVDVQMNDETNNAFLMSTTQFNGYVANY